MKARSPSALRAALARVTSAGSLAGGSSPGQSTPRSASGSAPEPSTSSGSERPAPAATEPDWLDDVVMEPRSQVLIVLVTIPIIVGWRDRSVRSPGRWPAPAVGPRADRAGALRAPAQGPVGRRLAARRRVSGIS